MIIFDTEFAEYYNKKIYTFLLVEFFDDYDEELFYEDLEAFFSQHLVREQKERCAKVLEDLYHWSGDEFKHRLTPFHELGLYNFLRYIDGYRNEDMQIFDDIYYDEDDKEEVSKIWGRLDKKEWSEIFITVEDLRRYLHDISNIIGDCFEDIDFITFPYLLGNSTDKNDELFPYGLVDAYGDLLPEDISQEYEILRKNIQKNLTVFEQLDEVLGVILHGVQYRGWHKLFWNRDQPKSEIEVHLCLDFLFDAYFNKSSINISRETDTGTGKIDFTFYSNPTDRVLVEVKLGSSPKLKHGAEKQLTHYMSATKYTDAYYLVVCFTDEELAKAEALQGKLHPKGQEKIAVVILDVTQRKTASKL